MIGEKVFVYLDDCGHYHVFPCRNREDLVAIYEAAAKHIIGYLEGQKEFESKKGDPITQEDIDACTSDAAKKMLEVELRKQQKRGASCLREINRIKNHIAAIKEGDEEAEEKFIENMYGFEIRLGSQRGEGGVCTVQEPNF